MRDEGVHRADPHTCSSCGAMRNRGVQCEGRRRVPLRMSTSNTEKPRDVAQQLARSRDPSGGSLSGECRCWRGLIVAGFSRWASLRSVETSLCGSDGDGPPSESKRDEFERPRNEDADQTVEHDMFKRSAVECGNLHRHPPRASLTETTRTHPTVITPTTGARSFPQSGI